MQENDKIPSWLRDKKKLIILGIVLLALILSSTNTLRIARIAVDKIPGVAEAKANIEGEVVDSVKSIFKSNKLTGTYSNSMSGETMVFGKDGSFTYVISGQMVPGTYSLDGDILTLCLNGGCYEFQVLQCDSSSLVMTDGYYQYEYQK